MRLPGYRRLAQCVVVLFLSAPFLHAQSATTSISGRVVDPSGAVVPEASISVTNEARSVWRETKTGTGGLFVIDQLAPLNYTVRVEKEGFQAVELENVTLNVTAGGTLGDVELRLPQPNQRVSVRTDTPLIADSGAVSTVIDQRFMDNQPLSGHSFQRLIDLSAGVAIHTSGLTTQGQFSTNGQRTGSNYFMIDGVSANFASTPSTALYETAGGGVPSFSAFGTTTSLASVDTVQEFSIQTSTYAPEFGRQPGAQVSIVTRSGTDSFHGSVFNYLRNSLFDANNF